MSWGGCKCDGCWEGVAYKHQEAHIYWSDSSEVGGDSGYSCREASDCEDDGVSAAFLASEGWDAWVVPVPVLGKGRAGHRGQAARCSVSGGHDTDGYRRCQPGPGARRGVHHHVVPQRQLPRHCLLTHRRSCNYAPSASCPRDDCRSVGSADALLEHFISGEKWPYTAENQAGESFDVRLWGGFNVVGAVRGNIQHLLVLYVARRPFGSTLSAMCICPQPDIISSSPETLKCKLELHFPDTHNPRTSIYEGRTSFDVPSTNPFDVFPNPDDFQFFVPKSVHSHDNAAIWVTASVTILE